MQREFLSDSARYALAAPVEEGTSRSLTPLQREAQLTRDYHRVEKGLAFGAPKRPFGAAVAERLDALHEPSQRPSLPNGSGRRRDRCGGHAPRCAASSPSVCNRQPWKVRVFEGADVADMLKYQNGNRGFRENVPMLAVISVELAHFSGAGERNQAWIEGGIFSSSLVWVLHALGLESCMLNLSITNAAADALRTAAGIPASEVPIMMIAFGYGAEGHRVARSPRRELDSVLVPAPEGAAVGV